MRRPHPCVRSHVSESVARAAELRTITCVSSQAWMQDASGEQCQPRNVTYDLISVLYHALQGCETYEMYADDAEQDGHTELAQFFRDAMEKDRHLAQRKQPRAGDR